MASSSPCPIARKVASNSGERMGSSPFSIAARLNLFLSTLRNRRSRAQDSLKARRRVEAWRASMPQRDTARLPGPYAVMQPRTPAGHTMQLESKRLGRTDVALSVLGFGGTALGNMY